MSGSRSDLSSVRNSAVDVLIPTKSTARRFSRGRANLRGSMPAEHAPTSVMLRSGSRVLIRPIRPEDKKALIDGLHRLTPESRYRRFFSLMPELSARQLRYLTEVDHRTHEALVATDPSTGDGIGVARFIRSTTDSRVAEVAVAVVDDWQGRRCWRPSPLAAARKAWSASLHPCSPSTEECSTCCAGSATQPSSTARLM